MKIEENKVVDEFSNRIVMVMHQMKSCGEEINDKRVVRKLLISILKKFDPIMVIIEEIKYLSSLSVHELQGSLKSYGKR